MPDSPWLLTVAGMLIGCILGGVARWNHFCTLSALERYWFANDSRGLRTWVLAAAVALGTTQLCQAYGLVDVSNSFYLAPRLGLTGAIAGGLLFGLGMALVGTCSFGALVRLGGGSLRSLVVVVAIGLAGLTAQRGVIGRLRLEYIEPMAIDLHPVGSQSIGDIASHFTGWPIQNHVAVLVTAIMLIWVFSDAGYRKETRSIFTAIVVGCCITAGWYVSQQLSEILFSPVQIESASFVMPPGELVLSLIAVTGTVPDYGVGLVVGVIAGASFIAWADDDMRWEACDDARELSRHLSGAFLMGTGGVLAAGCTIGQGVSAVSTLALSAPIVMVSIALGARMGLSWLLEGSLFGFLRSGKAT